MKVSIDGLRRGATGDMNALGELIESMISDMKSNFIDTDELIATYNQAASSVGVFNCVFEPEIEDDFNDLSEELQIKFIE